MDRSLTFLYSKALWLLLLLFCFRVVAQLLVYFFEVPLLPAFEQWHSGTMPYPMLLTYQLVIIAIFARIALRFSHGQVIARYRIGQVLLVLGGVYFTIMLVRLIVGLAGLSDLAWWNRSVPSFFHLVLALFLLVVGYFHWRYGKE